MGNDPGALLQKLDELQATDDGGRLPRAFGPYHLLASLAKGGMGEVFLARSGAFVGFEKHCVVKTLRPHLTDDREYVARFIDEARVVVQLGHRNICQVFDVGRVGERYYLAMEQIAGKDLRSVLDNAGTPVVTSPMSQARIPAMKEDSQPTLYIDHALAVHVIGEVLEALDYAHRFVDVSGRPLQLVHRDVSPQNVMVSFEGEVKLIDFGLAASTVKMEQTSPNVVMGKLAYMPPEQIRAEKLDRRADLFSAAVMLTEMITGERYYQGIGSYEVWTLAAQGDYRPRRFAQIEQGLRDILDTALAAKAAHRQESCAALREELVGWRQKRGLYADGATLRRLMHDCFSADLQAHRDLLAGVSSRAHPVAPRVGSAADADITQDGDAEGSKSFARKAAANAATVVVNNPLSRAGANLDPTEPTLASTPLYRPQKSRLAAAGVGAAIAVVVAGLVTVVTNDKPVSPVTPVVVAPVTPPVVIAPVTPHVTPPVTPPVVAPVVTPVAVEPPVVDDKVDPPVVALDATPKKKPPTSKKPPKEEKKPEETKPEPKPEPAPLPASNWAELGTTKKAEALQKACPSTPCAQTLGKDADTWASKPLAEMSQYKKDLEACHRTCGKP